MMNFIDYKNSIEEKNPPEQLKDTLMALWYDAKGDWDTAHSIAQQINSTAGFRVHAYLHRKEGDLSNASYWYSRAKQKRPGVSLEEEWQHLAREFLDES